MLNAEIVSAWLQWWHSGWWQQADESWQHLPFFQLTPQQQQTVAQQFPLKVAADLAATTAPPPEPLIRVLQITALSLAQRQQLFALIRETCAPHHAQTTLSASQKINCRRTAKALRCENWLEADEFAPQGVGELVLLQASAGAAWSRLRLLFPFEAVQRCEAVTPASPLPASRLGALWEAALWQTQQSEASADVDREEDHSAA